MSDAVFPSSDLPLSHDPAVGTGERRLRIWPGVVIVVLQLAAIFLPPLLMPGTVEQFLVRMYAPMLCALLLLIWWVFFSRLRWRDRLLIPGVLIAVSAAAAFLCDPSFVFGLMLYTLPVVTTVWVVWLLVTFFLSWPVRLYGVVAAFALLAGGSALIRMDGVDGSFSPEFSWRWGQTAEQRFLAEHATKAAGKGAGQEPVYLQPGDWPGFRGPMRDGRLTGVRIGTDWAAKPLRLLWRQRIGPGWGSFAVIGNRAYTQEQRDKAEVVACYDVDTGKEVWVHEDETRFKETVSGAGPRGTPTYHDGRLYALGANGRLNCLDAATGKVIWERDAAADAGAKVPMWGFASSPLVMQGLVTVYTGSGTDSKAVTAYDAANGGEPVWTGGDGTHGYCSPHPAVIGGVEQILMVSNAGLTALHPTRGEALWRYAFPTQEGMPRCVQPVLLGESEVLIGTGMGVGERCAKIPYPADPGAAPAEAWTANGLKAYFNDRVVHKDHVYGFDGNIFTCLSLADKGKARWRGGRDGNGQVLLLADQDLLLVLSEKGEVVLVAADPAGHRELGRFQAIEGKTWNHPVVAHGKLLVRNGEEVACYELPADR